jgi:hypothetical protein
VATNNRPDKDLEELLSHLSCAIARNVTPTTMFVCQHLLVCIMIALLVDVALQRTRTSKRWHQRIYQKGKALQRSLVTIVIIYKYTLFPNLNTAGHPLLLMVGMVSVEAHLLGVLRQVHRFDFLAQIDILITYTPLRHLYREERPRYIDVYLHEQNRR